MALITQFAGSRKGACLVRHAVADKQHFTAPYTRPLKQRGGQIQGGGGIVTFCGDDVGGERRQHGLNRGSIIGQGSHHVRLACEYDQRGSSLRGARKDIGNLETGAYQPRRCNVCSIHGGRQVQYDYAGNLCLIDGQGLTFPDRSGQCNNRQQPTRNEEQQPSPADASGRFKPEL